MTTWPRMNRLTLSAKTTDGLTVYDLDVHASELWLVAGPAGYDPYQIDPDSLPEGFRWVSNEEWEQIVAEGAND